MNNKIYIVNYRNPSERLELYCVPEKLEVSPGITMEVVGSMGRNNPFYMYTGGEDEIAFTIDWYSRTSTRRDVIEQCRLLESWGRNNGYAQSKPELLLVWGELFKNTLWTLKEMPYELTIFERGNGVLPRQGYQDIKMVKVVKRQTTWDDIRYNL